MANELRKKAKDLGLLALGLPDEVGGGGLNTIDMCLCEQEFGFTKDALLLVICFWREAPEPAVGPQKMPGNQ